MKKWVGNRHSHLKLGFIKLMPGSRNRSKQRGAKPLLLNLHSTTNEILQKRFIPGMTNYLKMLAKISRRKKYICFLFLEKIGFLKRVNLTTKIHVNNGKIILPIIKGIGFHNLISIERWKSALINRINDLIEGSFIDIGANIGQTLLLIKSLNKEQAYYGFEPNPLCYHYMTHLININNFENCTLIPVGLSDKDEVVTLLSNSDIDSCACVLDGFREQRFYSRKNYVPVFNGDKLIRGWDVKSISIIKIDVEGAELGVIEGLRGTIEKHKPYIICEILPVYDENTQIGSFRKRRQDSLIGILKEYGYRLLRIKHNGALEPLDAIHTHSDLSNCDYAFIPKGDIEQFSDFFETRTM